jgi:hypothetical protein
MIWIPISEGNRQHGLAENLEMYAGHSADDMSFHDGDTELLLARLDTRWQRDCHLTYSSSDTGVIPAHGCATPVVFAYSLLTDLGS